MTHPHPQTKALLSCLPACYLPLDVALAFRSLERKELR